VTGLTDEIWLKLYRRGMERQEVIVGLMNMKKLG